MVSDIMESPQPQTTVGWVIDAQGGPLFVKLLPCGGGRDHRDAHCSLATLKVDNLLTVFDPHNKPGVARNVRFAAQLERVHNELLSVAVGVWPLHRVTSDYVVARCSRLRDVISCVGGGADDADDGYGRGLIVGVNSDVRSRVERVLVVHRFDIETEVSRSHGGSWTTPDGTMRAVDVGSDDVIGGIHPVFLDPRNNTVFHSLSEVKDILEQLQDLNVAGSDQLLDLVSTIDTDTSVDDRQLPHPCIVVEGLDATGKSTIVEKLVKHLSGCRLYSPPESLHDLRSAFDSMPSIVRRAYYSLGNYLVAKSIEHHCEKGPVILDRFWHSTAAYAIAEESLLPTSSEHWVFRWPKDLIRPSLVIFLVASEHIREQRMEGRRATGTERTKEEVQLADDQRRRERTLLAYRSMTEPAVVEVNADGTPDHVMQLVLDVLQERSIL